MIRVLLATGLAVLAAAPLALAQTAPSAALPAMASGTSSPGNAGDKALMSGMGAMDHAMAKAPETGNTDQDFVAMMIPHHQGAVSMAQAELRYGHDPYLRHMARQIIAAQTREIAQMKAWQKAHPAP